MYPPNPNPGLIPTTNPNPTGIHISYLANHLRRGDNNPGGFGFGPSCLDPPVSFTFLHPVGPISV